MKRVFLVGILICGGSMAHAEARVEQNSPNQNSAKLETRLDRDSRIIRNMYPVDPCDACTTACRIEAPYSDGRLNCMEKCYEGPCKND